MNVARLIAMLLTLAAALVFYLACRSDLTCSNRLLRGLLGADGYAGLRAWFDAHAAAPGWWRGSAPSALWVMAATCLVGGWEARVPGGHRLPLAIVPVCINGLWEGVQYAGLTDGRADGADIVAGLLGWAIAVLIPFESPACVAPVDGWFDWRLAALAGVCGLMGFADVI